MSESTYTIKQVEDNCKFIEKGKTKLAQAVYCYKKGKKENDNLRYFIDVRLDKVNIAKSYEYDGTVSFYWDSDELLGRELRVDNPFIKLDYIPRLLLAVMHLQKYIKPLQESLLEQLFSEGSELIQKNFNKEAKNKARALYEYRQETIKILENAKDELLNLRLEIESRKYNS